MSLKVILKSKVKEYVTFTNIKLSKVPPRDTMFILL